MNNTIKFFTRLLFLFFITGCNNSGDIVITSLEESNFSDWRKHGDAFTFITEKQFRQEDNDIENNGADNNFLITSHSEKGDSAMGGISSPGIKINRDFLNFSIAGGNQKKLVGVGIFVDGVEIGKYTGDNNSKLRKEVVDLTAYQGKELVIEIIDNAVGKWGYINVSDIVLSDIPAYTNKEVILKMDKQYLVIPTNKKGKSQRGCIEIDGSHLFAFDVNIPEGEPDYYSFLDLTNLKGEELKISFSKVENSFLSSIDKITITDHVPGFDSLYQESLRPVFHYTPKRNWNNDPNGLCYDGELYHMYYQYKVLQHYCHYRNACWGHATSKDLIHWEEQPIAFYPPKGIGGTKSGSAVVDHENTSGFQTGEKPPIVAIYTAANSGDHVAYSNDGGYTFKEYEGNPILTGASQNRDPKILWYEKGKYWIMARHLQGEFIGFYTSDDLKNWTFQSKEPRFHSCPELFELPVDGDKNNTKWIIHGMYGDYKIGDFDGKKFIADTEKSYFSYGFGFAASQNFNDIPESDGRTIQLGWISNGNIPGMPFNQGMTFPSELSLRKTKFGLKMCAVPVREVALLHDREIKGKDLVKDEFNKLTKDFKEEAFHCKMKINKLSNPFSIQINGARIVIDPLKDVLTCYGSLNKRPIEPMPNSGTRKEVPLTREGAFTGPLDTDGEITLEILYDRTTVEIYGNNGALYMPLSNYFYPDLFTSLFAKGDPESLICYFPPEKKKIEIISMDEKARINTFELYSMKSMWEF